MSLSHHCSQVPVGTQGTRAGNSRHDIASSFRLEVLQKLEEEQRSGNIGATSPDTSRPNLPMCSSSRPSRQALISSRYFKPIPPDTSSQFWEGAQTPPPDTPSSQQSPNCRSNFQTVTCANQPGCPGPFGRGAICLAI